MPSRDIRPFLTAAKPVAARRAAPPRPLPQPAYERALETDHEVLATLHRFTLATAEQLHQLHGGAAEIKQTRARSEAYGPLDFLPALELPVGEAGVYTGPPPSSLHRRHRLRALIERHHLGAGNEQTAAQLAACSRVGEQAGEEGAGRRGSGAGAPSGGC
ncbi:hypothetical protein [Kitasatospora aureofaciens]|uniref:hypothetical protein n=1 Tax=Kitasatospora aureofaciens TaxID=1894 RepID=UPI0012FEBB6D|nr:hypothetical protein [Kitasatospora aureofaciens]